jgi:two-component sensor histidine kinase
MRYCAGRFEPVRDGLPPGTINSLLTDHTGSLWVGTSQGGVARIDEPASPKPRFRRFGMKEGLRSNHVLALAEDRRGRIYVGGGQGIDIIDPSTGDVQRFAGSGLPPGEIEEIHCDRSGALWFGSMFGLARYLPDGEAPSQPGPPTIREVRVAGVPVLVSDEGESQIADLRFPPGRDAIEITYGAIDFSAGNRARYRYRLWGRDKDWRGPTASRQVQYAAIGPGSYRFEVQVVDAKGIPGDLTASVVFRIDAPFWKTTWFLSIAGFCAACLVYAAHRYRVRHLLALETVRSRVAADLHDDLGSGLAEIAILTEVARQKRGDAGLETIAQRARELRGAMNDIVWSVDPECDNLDGLIRRCRQTAFALLGNDTLEFLAPDPDEACNVDLSPERRRHLYLLFKEVITNTVRHAGATSVAVRVELDNGDLALEIRDNGCGFDRVKVSAGNGLRTITERAEVLRARLVIDSTPGEGTTVRVRVPQV